VTHCDCSCEDVDDYDVAAAADAAYLVMRTIRVR